MVHVLRTGLLVAGGMSALALGGDLVARSAGVSTIAFAQADPIANTNPTTILAGFLVMAAGSFSALLWQLKKKDDQIDRLVVQLDKIGDALHACQRECGGHNSGGIRRESQ